MRGLAALCILLLLGIGAGLVIQGGGWYDILGWAAGYEHRYIHAGVAVLVVWLAIVWGVLRGGSADRTVAFKMQYGEVRFSSRAIEDCVRRVAHDVPELLEIQPRVARSRKGLIIRCLVTLQTGTDLRKATSVIQNRIYDHVRGVLGVEEIADIPIIVKKWAPADGAATSTVLRSHEGGSAGEDSAS